MRMKIGSMIVACSLTVLAFSSPSLACPKERIAGSGAKQAVVTQVVDARPACSRSGKNTRAVEVASDTAACRAAARAWAVAAGGEKTIPARRTGAQNACCAERLAQVRAVAGGATFDVAACAKAKAVAASNEKAACCVAAVARGVRAAAGPSVCSAAPARYVAFGCEKTDRVARAAARAYIDLMRELKLSSGAEGCSAKAASQVLASVLDQMRAERTAQTPDAPVADVKTTSVSLGVVSGSADAPKSPTCSKSRN